MNNPSNTISAGLTHSYRDFGNRVHALADQLSEEQFWIRPYPYGNSFGNLVLHLTGNLSYYIGAQIAGSGYIRERPREFADTHPGRKDEVLGKLDEAIDLVIASLGAQSDDDWARGYSAVGVDDTNRFGIYLKCAAHFHHHIGQMIYLVKELTK